MPFVAGPESFAADQANRVLERMLDRLLKDGKVAAVHKIADGVFHVPKFGPQCLKIPLDIQEQLENAGFPVRRLGDVIERAKPQWVEGDHAALRLRGNEIRRGKMWFQDGDPIKLNAFRRYVYTGFSHAVLPATSDINQVPVLAKPFHDYNETLGKYAPEFGAQWKANHVIVTHYADASKGIGLHSDKTKSLGDDSLITVIKTGKASRPWVITNLDETVEIFNERLPPGDAVLMTTGANKLYKHGVPEVLADNNVVGKRKRKYADVEPTGSIVLRTVTDAITVEELDKRIAQLDRGREKREKQKLQKREHEEQAERAKIEAAERELCENALNWDDSEDEE